MKLATLCYVKDKQNKKTLMLHRVKKQNDIHQGKWNGLGGKFDDGETPEECVIREIREESGLVIKDPVMKGFLTFPAFKDDEDWFVFVFLAPHYSGHLIESTEGNLEWIADKDLTSLNLWEGDAIFFPWLDQEKFFSGKFVYQNGKLLEYSVHFY